jgi:hypothetical protein
LSVVAEVRVVAREHEADMSVLLESKKRVNHPVLTLMHR